MNELIYCDNTASTIGFAIIFYHIQFRTVIQNDVHRSIKSCSNIHYYASSTSLISNRYVPTGRKIRSCDFMKQKKVVINYDQF